MYERVITMKKMTAITVLFITIILFGTGCGSEKSEGYSLISDNVEFGEDDYQEIVSSTNELGFELLTRVDADENNNIFISPTSLMTALSMVYNGSDGETKEEISSALQLPGIHLDDLNKANASLVTKLYKDMDQVTVNIANSIWLNDQYNFQEQFAQNNRDYYHAEIEEIDILDRKSAQVINDWVKKSTNNKIDDIVEEPLNENLLALLINAIYFKGQWTYEFDEKQTEVRDFHLEDGTTKEVPLMTLHEELYYMENKDFQAAKLPYGNGEMAMTIFLPQADSTLEQFKEMILYDHWKKWDMEFREKEGTIMLPKFTLAYETSLNKALTELGVNTAFDPNDANFSNMIKEDDQIFISDVKQKTFIEVNEVGTEAAAATSVEIRLTSAPADGPFYMEVNRPFFFTITDEETGAIIFMGSIANPEED